MRTAGTVTRKLSAENKTIIKSACVGFASARLKGSGE